MQISELIAELVYIQKVHGDLEVYVENEENPEDHWGIYRVRAGAFVGWNLYMKVALIDTDQPLQRKK